MNVSAGKTGILAEHISREQKFARPCRRVNIIILIYDLKVHKR